jgi:hypothetical protein
VGFKVLKWVPLDELTFEEKLNWDEERGNIGEKVLTVDEMQIQNKADDARSCSEDADIHSSGANQERDNDETDHRLSKRMKS